MLRWPATYACGHPRAGPPHPHGGEPLNRHTDGARTAPIRSAASPKRLPRAARLALLTIPLLVLAAASVVHADSIATVLPPDGLHLRAAPGTQHPSLDLIPGGTEVALTGDKNDAGWYPAAYKGKRGWLLGEFLDVPGDAASLTRRAIVRAADGVNLRDEPNTDATRLTTVPGGTSITVSARTTEDGWVLAAHGGQTGWIAAEHLRVESAPAPSPSPSRSPSASAAPAGGTPTRVTLTYYHASLEGGPMACGGRYRAEDPTIAAATSWPCGTRLRVCRNGNCITVTVQDTGHLGSNWLDLSAAAFRQLAPLPDSLVTATAEVLPPEP